VELVAVAGGMAAPSRSWRGAKRLTAGARSLALGVTPGLPAGPVEAMVGTAAAAGGICGGGMAGGVKAGAAAVGLNAGMAVGLAAGIANGLGAAGLVKLGAMATMVAGLRAGSSRVSPSVAVADAASMTPVLEMDLSTKPSSTLLPTR
jgi:hypothetical protein